MKNIPKYILFLLIGTLLGSSITFLLMRNNGTCLNKCDVGNYSNNNFEPVYEAYNTIKNEYYKDIDDSKLIDGMINGIMLATEDKHTMFFNEEQTNEFLTDLSGSYYGIGAQIYQADDEYVTISRVFNNSPAQKSGLQIGDKFVSIDGESMKGKNPTEVSTILRSSESSKATLVIKRGEEEKTIEVEKSVVEIDSVYSEKLEDNIGYIEINTFSTLTDNQFTEALYKLENEEIDSLIIDLRGNGGGYLSTVTNIISRFVDTNSVIYQIKGRNKTEKYNSLNDSKLNYKVVVLVDENSASASEIMASALKEQYGAILVGKTTYGKGTVQEMKNLSNKTLIKYTIEEWLTSSGNSIDGVGVTPDYEVELSDEFYSNPVKENDNQLQKAIELLK